jgi:hypothetical protein
MDHVLVNSCLGVVLVMSGCSDDEHNGVTSWANSSVQR